MSRPAASLWRVPAFYFIHFFSVGVLLPFLNVYYHTVGMSGAQLGFLNAAPRLAQAVGPPALSALADKLRRGREVLLVCSALSAALILLVWGVRSFWPLLILVTAYTVARGPLVPVAENLCLRDIRERGGQYGRVRWWGSLGFIVAATAAGWLIDRVTIGAMFPLVAASSVALMGVIFFFPRESGPPRTRFRGDLAALLRRRPLVVFLLASMLVSVSGGPFGIYFSIHLRGLGMSGGMVGLAWTVGVVSEIFFLIFAQAIQRRVGLKAMIAAGMLASALRWEMTAWTSDAAYLVAIQTLHGVSFGVYHVAAVQYVDRLSGPATKNTAQSLYGAATFGVGSTVGVLGAGFLLPVLGFIPLLHAGAALALAAGLGFILLPDGEGGAGDGGPEEWRPGGARPATWDGSL
ncbi:MAG: MFS transporter [bacterium]